MFLFQRFSAFTQITFGDGLRMYSHWYEEAIVVQGGENEMDGCNYIIYNLNKKR